MTDSSQHEQDEPEEHDPMPANDSLYIIPGLRVRKVLPATRSATPRGDDQVRQAPHLSKGFKSVVVTGAPEDGTKRKLRGYETKHPSPPPQPPPPAGTPEITTPIPGILRDLQGADNFGRRDTATDPSRRFFKGVSKGFRRSGDVDPGVGGA